MVLNNSTLLGFCNTFAAVLDPFISIVNSFLSVLNFAFPSASALCGTLFGAG